MGKLQQAKKAMDRAKAELDSCQRPVTGKTYDHVPTMGETIMDESDNRCRGIHYAYALRKYEHAKALVEYYKKPLPIRLLLNEKPRY